MPKTTLSSHRIHATPVCVLYCEFQGACQGREKKQNGGIAEWRNGHYTNNWRSERRHIQVMTIEICDIYKYVKFDHKCACTVILLFSVCRLRGRGFDSRIGTFFFHSFFFCLIFPPFFFLHARSAISMLKPAAHCYVATIATVDFHCQWSQIVMWFDVTAAGEVTEAIMWPLSSIQLVALSVTTKGL